jgi:Protein of unknown function (DUF2752)
LHAVDRSRASALGADHPLGRAARVGFVAAGFSVLLVLHVPLCPFALVTHRPCPGCGLGRATLALLSGDLGAAIHAHPLAPLVSPIVIAALASNALRYVRRGVWGGVEGLRAPVVALAAWVVAAALVAVWIARFFGLFGGPVAV